MRVSCTKRRQTGVTRHGICGVHDREIADEENDRIQRFGKMMRKTANGSEILLYDGCNFFRQRLMYSMLSGRPVIISKIRADSDAPGVQDHEIKLIALLEKMTNGTKIEINKTGTQIRFFPGMLWGGEVEMDCGTDRALSFFLEPVFGLAPFCKQPLRLKLTGVTNAPGELSVDALKHAWLPVYKKFVFNDEGLELNVKCRGFKPDGGGVVLFSSPAVKKLRSVQVEKPGKVCKIRGLAYCCKVSPVLAHREIDAAKQRLHGYLADVYITVDQRKGVQGGSSPGFGLILWATTTEGAIYVGEAVSQPRSDEHSANPVMPEEVGEQAADRLLSAIYNGGCVDVSAQWLAATLMSLCERDVSRCLVGPLSTYTTHSLRHLRDFFQQLFKLDDWATEQKRRQEKERRGDNDGSNGDDGDDGETKKLKKSGDDQANGDGGEELYRVGDPHKVLMTCVGVGYSNLSKVTI